MNDEKWEDAMLKIKENFQLEEELTEDHPEIESGIIETVVFDSPMGRIKLIRTTTPKVLDKKTFYSSRSGSDMSVKYDYSATEFVNNLEIFKWNGSQDAWQEASLEF
ncbi:hypothetical protein HN858_05515 [Candidatus Falkowbacteria bacterium]|jgi:hypothetical protein|nr:hypothetical protein [Candidatus Falkowbacteria bacterium]MBT5502918.1 hypothetical protein [Candidatus Falkowbacteria bacterium]MBT6573718.1 hypothetical protein [Candidatus Falkowbacteria bacterium]MBT7349094.1 hypothetical protein [Candidatus Falkowbacteria bacterium]MBT7500045.1 hypothetical protein [Candidatus Falkowbacteria bacterium]